MDGLDRPLSVLGDQSTANRQAVLLVRAACLEVTSDQVSGQRKAQRGAQPSRIQIQRLCLCVAVVIGLTAGWSMPAAAHGGVSGVYIQHRQVGPYVISVRVDAGDEREDHNEEALAEAPVDLSKLEKELGISARERNSMVVEVRVQDARTGEWVKGASVVAVAGLWEPGKEELTTVRPIQVIESLTELGLYQVVLPLDPSQGPWRVLVAVWEDAYENRVEVDFTLRTGAEGFPWLPVAAVGGLGIVLVGGGLLFMQTIAPRLRHPAALTEKTRPSGRGQMNLGKRRS